MENRDRSEERLPQAVETKLNEAYDMIRRGEVKRQEKRTRSGYRRWSGIAAACAVMLTASVGVLAAAGYFHWEARREADRIVYEFDLNYELVPGTFKVTPGYLPEGYIDRGDLKYDRGDYRGISVLPIYSAAELERLDAELSVKDVEKVEHTTLCGMEADILTCGEDGGYTRIYLFNPAQGYVLEIYADAQVDREELLKFTDQLQIERVEDTAYETEEERASRKAEEHAETERMETGERNQRELLAVGVPQEKIYGIGEELRAFDGAYGYTLLGYEYLDSMEGVDAVQTVDPARLKGWLLEDGKLKSYTRRHWDAEGTLLEEKTAEQRFLQVEIRLHCYDSSVFGAAPLQLDRCGVEERAEGGWTWAQDRYAPAPGDANELQMDGMPIWTDAAQNLEGEARKQYFFRDLEDGEELRYTLLYVVDRDEQPFFLSPSGANSSIFQNESLSAQEMLEGLDGYIRLDK